MKLLKLIAGTIGFAILYLLGKSISKNKDDFEGMVEGEDYNHPVFQGSKPTGKTKVIWKREIKN